MSSDAASARGRMVVLSGPSGSGKTTVGKRLAATDGISRVVTATSRPPREGEEHGRDYLFFSKEEFEERIAAGGFLEHVETLGRYYGTPRESVESIVSRGEFALMIIDVKGAALVRASDGDGIFIFLVPPSTEELERRLRGRGTETEEAVKKRLALAEEEMLEKEKYDHEVVNDTVENAVAGILEILAGYGLKRNQ